MTKWTSMPHQFIMVNLFHWQKVEITNPMNVTLDTSDTLYCSSAGNGNPTCDVL